MWINVWPSHKQLSRPGSDRQLACEVVLNSIQGWLSAVVSDLNILSLLCELHLRTQRTQRNIKDCVKSVCITISLKFEYVGDPSQMLWGPPWTDRQRRCQLQPATTSQVVQRHMRTRLEKRYALHVRSKCTHRKTGNVYFISMTRAQLLMVSIAQKITKLKFKFNFLQNYIVTYKCTQFI